MSDRKLMLVVESISVYTLRDKVNAIHDSELSDYGYPKWIADEILSVQILPEGETNTYMAAVLVRATEDHPMYMR